MANEPVQYSLQDQVATINIDDGKRNALSPQVLREIYEAETGFTQQIDVGTPARAPESTE